MKRVPLLPDYPRPLIFAHRGCSSLAPENTMAAYRLARQYGAPGIELDIHACATGELVVFHDDNLKRTTGLDKKVEETPFDEIRSLDAGGWFSKDFSGEKIPLLDEVLEEFSGEMYIDIELKTRKAKNDPLPAMLAQALQAHGGSKRDLASRITVSSFNPLAIAAFKKEAPHIATAIIWCNDGELPSYLHHGEGRWLSRCDYLKPISDKATMFSLTLLSRVGGRKLVPWTVDDPVLAKKLVGLGCAGVVTNRPQDIVPALVG